jgi:hypothetical protein
VRSHKGTVNYRYLAPPAAVIAIVGSIITSLFFGGIALLPVAAYLVLIFMGSLIIGKSIFEKLLLPFVIGTMHLVWGAGFLLSPKGLIAEEE